MIDYDAIIALNAANVAATSPMDRAALQDYLDAAFHVGLRDEGRAAFLIALYEKSKHDGLNFSWFRARYDKFVYVDRIVVAVEQRGTGHARSLYGELIAKATDAGHGFLCCEVNVEPRNEESLAFHSSMGFVEVGRAALTGKGKTVAYLGKDLRSAAL